MLFQRKFFLDLEAEAGKTRAPSAVVAVAAPKPAPAAKPTAAPKPASAAVAPPPATAPAAVQASASAASAAQPPALTTAEAIAAELAAEQANRPAPTLATFAPDCLSPGALQLRRRRGGADLARFRTLAGGLLRS
jgi:hypothetical protein